MKLTDKISLIMTKVEILKLMADDYKWQCHTPKDVQAELEKTLAEINAALSGQARTEGS